MALTEKQIAERQLGLGGSDAAVALGLSRWKDPLTLYEEKRGEREPEPANWEMERGNAMEPLILRWYAEHEGVAVREIETLIHPDPKLAFLRSNVDGINERGRLVEAKSADWPHGWGEPGTDEIPEEHFLQVQHYLTVGRALGIIKEPIADVPVWISASNHKRRLYHVEEDLALREMLVDGLAEFWSCVKEGRPPSSAVVPASEILRSVAGSITATEKLIKACIRAKEIKESVKILGAELDDIKAIVGSFMGENETLVDESNRKLVGWKTSKAGTVLDGKRLKAEKPDVHAEYQKDKKASRPMLFK